MGRHALALAILLFLSTACTAQSSNILMEKMPENYADFWSGWWLPQAFAPYALFSNVENLKLGGINDTAPSLLLTSGESAVFADSIAGYERSRASIRDAKYWEKDTLLYFSFPVSGATTLATLVTLKELFPRIQGTLTSSRTALSESNRATNTALDVLLERMETLGHLGAGEPDYGGAGSGPYSEMLDLLVQSNNTALKSQRYPDLARRYSTVLEHSKDVEDAFYRGGTAFADSHSFSNALNYSLAGSDNMLALFVGMYRESMQAEQGMKNEYESALAEATEKQKECSDAYEDLARTQGYSSIDANIASEFTPGGPVLLSYPSMRLSRISTTSECRTGSQISQAKWLHGQTTRDHYLAKSILLLRQANLDVAVSLAELNDARYEAESMLANAPSAVSRERATAFAAISSFSSKTEAEASLLQRAQSLLQAGDDLEAQARSSTSAGTILQARYGAILKYRDAARSISAPEVYAASKKQDASRSTQDLQEAINKAKTDGINSDYEQDQLALLQKQLNINDTALHSSISDVADELSSSLFEKAHMQYASLETERASLEADFGAMGGDMPAALAPSYSKFLELDSKYFEGGQLAPSSLGNLKAIQSSFASIRKAIDSQKQEIVIKNMPKLYSLSVTPEGTPTLDQPSSFTIDLTLPNNSPFAVSSQTTLSIPFPYEVSEADITSKSSNIASIACPRGTLVMQLSSIPANSITRISFRKSFKPAETDSSSEKVLSLSPSLLRKEVTVRFTASSQLSTLRALILLPSAAPSMLSAHLDSAQADAKLTTSSGSPAAEVTMRGVSQGGHELKLYYEVQNPYSITQSNRQVKSTGGSNATISFDITVSSSIGQLEDVPVYLVEDGATTAKYPSVVGSASAPLSLKIEATPGGTSFSWKAPLLRPGEPLLYSVQYAVTDLSAYVGSILPAPSEGTASLREKFSAELASFESEERQYSGAISSLRAMGESAEANKFSYALDSASSLKTSAMLLADNGQYSEALAAIAAARSSLRGIALEKTFGSLRSSLFEGMQSAKADALKLSALGNANETLALLGNAESSLASAAASASSADWSAAFASLGTANASLASSLASLENAERGQIAQFNSRYSQYLSRKGNMSSSISKLTIALTYTVANAEVKKARLDSPLDIEKLKSSISSDEKAIDAASKKLDISKPSTVIANAQGLQQAQDALNSLSASEQQLAGAYSSLERKANLSDENARLMLAQLAELAPRNDKQLADEQSSLTALLADSQSSLDSGRLLDSLSLSQHIQGRVLKALDRLPSAPAQQPAFALTSDVLIIALSLAFIAGLVFLFARRRPSAPATLHKLPSAGEESGFEL